MLDTRHFDESFKDKLLAALSDDDDTPLDKQLDGLLIHGDNFQALNLLQTRYRGQVKCVYIDPPYNTDMSPILYKNDYRHSSWMSLIKQGLQLAKGYLTSDGVLSVAIDDEELYRLKMLIDGIMNSDRYIGTISLQSNPGGRDINTHFATSHDYCIFYANLGQHEMLLPRGDEKGREQVNGFRRTGGLSSPEERENSEFAFYYDPDNLSIVGVGGKRVSAYPAEYEPTCVHCTDSHGHAIEMAPTSFKRKNPRAKEILPRFSNQDRGVWRWSNRVKILTAVHKGDIFLHDGPRSDVTVKIKSIVKPTYKPKTIWAESEYSSTTYGTMLLQKIFGKKDKFSYPKSIFSTQRAVESSTFGKQGALVLDYFAGSGTTAHAVINLNREDDGNRKYILVEVGHHFNDVLLPRIKKVVYSKKWRDGQPVECDGGRDGVSQFLKYIRIESYEDTLDSLVVNPRRDLFEKSELKRIAEEYQLRYALGVETADSASLVGKDFINPAQYNLSVLRDGARRDQTADLAETFNFLLGLRLAGRRRIDNILAITGTNAGGQKCLILWRDMNKIKAADLDQWFTKHRTKFGTSIDLIYVNGDHTLNALKTPAEYWKAVTTETIFRELMFNSACI